MRTSYQGAVLTHQTLVQTLAIYRTETKILHDNLHIQYTCTCTVCACILHVACMTSNIQHNVYSSSYLYNISGIWPEDTSVPLLDSLVPLNLKIILQVKYIHTYSEIRVSSQLSKEDTSLPVIAGSDTEVAL